MNVIGWIGCSHEIYVPCLVCCTWRMNNRKKNGKMISFVMIGRLNLL